MRFALSVPRTGPTAAAGRSWPIARAAVPSFAPLPPPERRDGPLEPLLAWLDRQSQRAALAELDDRLLDDIGVSRAEALSECNRFD